MLVGGSSRIKWVQEMLSNRFPNREIQLAKNPDECVAQGAAYYAYMLHNSGRPGIPQFTVESDLQEMLISNDEKNEIKIALVGENSSAMN